MTNLMSLHYQQNHKFTLALAPIAIDRILKVCVRYFLSIFYFPPNDSPSETMKNVFLFHLKSSFRS